MHNHFSDNELTTLLLRAQRIAHATQTEDDKSDNALIVRLWGEVYGLPIDSLTAVYQNIHIVPVPCTPGYVAGIANIRGHILPVLDLAMLLEIQSFQRETAGTLVVISHPEMEVAIQVDAVDNIRPYASSRLLPIPENFDAAPRQYLTGLLPDGAAILNIESLLKNPELIIDEKIQ